MPAYKLSEFADEDIFRIVHYTIQNFGIAQARSYLTRALELLVQNPELEEGILVSRVLHHSIDIEVQDFSA
jgi:toxin ParE1/3/4